MRTITIHIDAPSMANLIIERDTTPSLEFLFYEDKAQTTPITTSDYTWECYMKLTTDTANASAALSWQDADIEKAPGGVTNKIKVPISRAETNDPGILLDRGVWHLYWTDGAGHRERVMRGAFEARD